jgi:hypothetical protein
MFCGYILLSVWCIDFGLLSPHQLRRCLMAPLALRPIRWLTRPASSSAVVCTNSVSHDVLTQQLPL